MFFAEFILFSFFLRCLSFPIDLQLFGKAREDRQFLKSTSIQHTHFRIHHQHMRSSLKKREKARISDL
uniref:Secreted protein n=1 Tax=Anguilla anguilla TaxID=7936 RepID=A0A0E9RRY0_ANGAN